MSYTIIGRFDCPWCDKASGLLDKRELNYNYITIEGDRWLVTLMKKAGYTTVPLIFDPDNKVVGGYTELEALLKDKESKT